MTSTATMEVIGEALAFLAAVLILVPALRVSWGLRNVQTTEAFFTSSNADESMQRIANAWATTVRPIIERWKPVDHYCLVGGLAAQGMASAMKIVLLLVH